MMDSDCTGGRAAMQFDTASQNLLMMKNIYQKWQNLKRMAN